MSFFKAMDSGIGSGPSFRNGHRPGPVGVIVWIMPKPTTRSHAIHCGRARGNRGLFLPYPHGKARMPMKDSPPSPPSPAHAAAIALMRRASGPVPFDLSTLDVPPSSC